MQEITVEVTKGLGRLIKPGMSEFELAEAYTRMLSDNGLKDHWYPILVYAGEITGKPISRRFHLPSADVAVEENDIVMLDSTPIDGTVWSNWSETFLIGKDDFYQAIISDTEKIVDETYDYLASEAKTVGDIYDFCNLRISNYGLQSLDPRNDVGHSIFQVPEGQTVDKTPMGDRLFINEEYRNSPIEGIISIEPQLGRINPADGKMYSAKMQKVFICP